jgi:hypothetical protein
MITNTTNNPSGKPGELHLSYDPATRQYLQRRCAEGKTKTEAIRCLKRYVAREIFRALPR